MAWAEPLKKKTAEFTAIAIDSILTQMREFPTHLITDAGTEFFNSEVAKVFLNYGVNHYKTPTLTKWKASLVERLIRTIKTRLEKYFTQNKTHNWADVIHDVIKNYNATPHSAHTLAPKDVNEKNRAEVYKRLYPDLTLRTVCKLKVGDKVRKLKHKELWEKGYTQNWTDQIYKITKSLQQNGVCWYYISDLSNTPQKGIYYYYQLNLVSRNDN